MSPTQTAPSVAVAVAIVGDRDPDFAPHLATEAAFAHLADPPRVEWIPTDSIDPAAPEERLARFAGILVSPGSPYRSTEGALAAIRWARQRGVPLLGTCGGFQHLVLEFARNVLGVADAAHQETDPGAPRLVVTALACSLAGQQHPVRLLPGSRIAAICGAGRAVEPFLCRYGLSAAYQPALAEHGLTVTGTDEQGEPRVVELRDHPFFIGTLYVPQLRSRPGAPHPIIEALVAAARARA
jgi:CTP synthase (UTP-ammonia lyase)